MGRGSPRFCGVGGEDALAGEGGEEGDLGKGGREEVEVGDEERGVRAADDADFGAGNAAVAEKRPGGGVAAREANRMRAEGALVVAASEGGERAVPAVDRAA